MRSTTSNYDAENAKNTNKPVIIVEPSGLTRKWASNSFANITANHKKKIKSMRNTLFNIDLLNNPFGRTGESEFEITDGDHDVTLQLTNNDFEGRDVTIKSGFEALNDGDFVSLPIQKFKGRIRRGPENLSWIFTTEDARRILDRDIFRHPYITDLNGDITATATTLTVDDATGLIDPNLLSTRLATHFVGAVGSDGEIITYQSISTNTLQTLGRGTFGSSPQDHKDNAKVIQYFIFHDLRITDVFLYLLMTTEDASGHNFYDLSREDTGFSGLGLGLTENEVDVEQIERLGYYFPRTTIELGSDRPVNAISWFEEFVLKPFALYVIVRDGKIKLGSFDFIYLNENFTASDTLTDQHIDELVSDIEQNNLVNDLELKHYPMIKSNQFIQTDRFELDSSVTQYGKTETPFVREIPALVTGPDKLLKWFASQWLWFFGNIPGIFTVLTKRQKWLLEAGDFIQVTFSKAPDLQSGTLGWTNKKALILGQSINWFGDEGTREFKLECITWELFDRVSNFYTLDGTITSGYIDRTAVTFSPTNDNTLEAADGYFDFGATTAVDAVIITVRITPPATGSTHHYISLAIRAQEDVLGTFYSNGSRNIRFIRYLSSDSAAFDIDLFLVVDDPGSNNVDRIKVDWYERSTTGPEQPSSVSIQQIKYMTFNENITKL